MDFKHYVRNAQTAERGKFEMIFFDDGIGIREPDTPPGFLARSGYEFIEMEPMTLLPALAALTSHIGLVTTASTTYNEPYHIARKFGTLDLISGGRRVEHRHLLVGGRGAQKGRMTRYGRDADDLKIMPALRPIAGRTVAEAQAKFNGMQALLDPLVGLQRLFSVFGELSGCDPDVPVPLDALGPPKIRSFSEQWVNRVKREKITIRQLYEAKAGGGGFHLDRDRAADRGCHGAVDRGGGLRRSQHHAVYAARRLRRFRRDDHV